MTIELDENYQTEINIEVLAMIDAAITNATGVDRLWITDAMLPDFLPHLERLVRRALTTHKVI